MSVEPFRVFTFSGTASELAQMLRERSSDAYWLGFAHGGGLPSLGDVYEWSLTASISRHPAGKRLGPIEGLHDSNADGMRGPRCTNRMVAGTRMTDVCADCGRPMMTHST